MYGLYFDSNDKKRMMTESQQFHTPHFAGSLNRFNFINNSTTDYADIIGKTISHYKVLKKIGEGGMGYVYKAFDINLQRPVALKILPPHLCKKEEEKNQFLKEARLLSSLEHPYICTIHDIFESEDGALYMVMTCYQGNTLREHLINGGISREKAIVIIKQIASGLLCAHEKGIVHQDVKPENVILTSDNIVKIIDFGVAQLIGQHGKGKSKTSMGTLAYMSPEQAGRHPIDHRTDIWSLGVVFYEMLSGKLPFQEEFEEALVYSILNENVPELRRIPKPLKKIIKRCLEKNREVRYQELRTVLNDLEVFLTRSRFKKSTLKGSWLL